jgi:putrescine transport system substrate-binding protein
MNWRIPGKSLLTALVATALFGLCISPLQAEQVINLYNWGDYIDTEVLDEFEAEYNIRVNMDTYDSAEIVDTKLLTGSSGYDVVIHASSNSAPLMAIGVFHPVDFSRITNIKHLDPIIYQTLQQRYGENFGGVPYMWGTTGIAYNTRMIAERMPDAPLHSSAMLFDPAIISKFADCGVTMLDDPSAVLSMALLYLGYPPDSYDREHLREVEELFAVLRPYIKYYNNSKMLLDLPSEEVCLAMTWSGDFAVANMRAREAGLDIEIRYQVPMEGATDWMDNLYIPADAPNADGAYLLIDFLTRPEIAARNTNLTGYANAVGGATPLVDKEISQDKAIYPDAEIWQRLYPSDVLPPKQQRVRTRSWTKIKSGL